MDDDGQDTSPQRSVILELNKIRETFRSTLLAYSVHVEQAIGSVEASTETLSRKKKMLPSQTRDLRDMMTLLGNFSVKPEKGRRKDLKKIEDLLGDLAMLAESWSKE